MASEKYIDLHTHSVFSDGLCEPAELVRRAVAAGMHALALSDHDSLAGFGALARAAGEVGLEVITGVELSCEFQGRDLHVLGYGVSVEYQQLQDALQVFRDARETRGIAIIDKLHGLGVYVDKDAIMKKAEGGALGRPHIAEALLEGGYVSSFGEAFDRYIGEDCPAYVEKYKMSPNEAVTRIREAGGLSFIAHPGYYLQHDPDLNALLEYGFDGIEIYHPSHNRKTTEHLTQIAASRGIMASGGSDFHGVEGRNIIGEVPVPYELLEKIKERLASV